MSTKHKRLNWMKTFEKLQMFKMSHGNSVKIENYKSLLRVCELVCLSFLSLPNVMRSKLK